MIEDGSMNRTPSVPHDGNMKRTVGWSRILVLMAGCHHDAWSDGWMIEDGSMNRTPSVPCDGDMKRTVGCMSHGRCGVGDGRSYLVICSVMFGLKVPLGEGESERRGFLVCTEHCSFLLQDLYGK
jgi:hypothetical protein